MLVKREDNVLSHPPTLTTLYLCLFVKCLLLHTIQKRDSLLVCAEKWATRWVSPARIKIHIPVIWISSQLPKLQHPEVKLLGEKESCSISVCASPQRKHIASHPGIRFTSERRRRKRSSKRISMYADIRKGAGGKRRQSAKSWKRWPGTGCLFPLGELIPQSSDIHYFIWGKHVVTRCARHSNGAWRKKKNTRTASATSIWKCFSQTLPSLLWRSNWENWETSSLVTLPVLSSEGDNRLHSSSVCLRASSFPTFALQWL